MHRHYFRCNLCLTPWTQESDSNHEPKPETQDCPFCGNPLYDAKDPKRPGGPKENFTYMGVVHGDHLEKAIGERTACDERCTGATGPSCDCRCMGKNHGTGLTIPVIQTGKIPKRFSLDKIKLQVSEFKDSLLKAEDAFTKKYRQAWMDKRDGKYVPGDVFWPMDRAWRTLKDARSAQSHHSRMEKLTNLLAELSGRLP